MFVNKEISELIYGLINSTKILDIDGVLCAVSFHSIDDRIIKYYFKSLSELNASLGLKELSMGMSSDYLIAVNFRATYLRIGSLIFGERS